MDRRLLSLMFVLFLSVILFVAAVVFQQPLARFTRAKEEFTISPTASKVLIWPVTVNADGSSFALVNVFLSSQTGKPISNKKIVLDVTIGTVSPIDAVSDTNGKAMFKVVSTTEGVATIAITADETVRLIQTPPITILFTNK